MRCVIAMVAVLLLLGGCATSPNDAASQAYVAEGHDYVMPLVRKNGHLYARAAINGRHVGFFLIDTGANVVAIDPTFADELDLPHVGSANITGVGGTHGADIRRIDDLNVGGLSFGRHRALTVDLAHLSTTSHRDVVGILGYNALRTRPFTIDYSRRTLVFHDARYFKPPADASEHELLNISRLPMVHAELPPHGRAWMLIDYGSNAWVSLPGKSLERWPSLLDGMPNEQSSTWGVGGHIKDVRSVLRELRMFDLTLSNLLMDVEWTDRQAEHAGRIIGRVGTGLLKDFVLTFDAGNDKVYVRWLPADR